MLAPQDAIGPGIRHDDGGLIYSNLSNRDNGLLDIVNADEALRVVVEIVFLRQAKIREAGVCHLAPTRLNQSNYLFQAPGVGYKGPGSICCDKRH